MSTMSTPIIDVFAGPGGLGEGFSALADENGRKAFRLALSIEKDEVACRTLKLRAVRRHLAGVGALHTYYALLRGEISRPEFDALDQVRAASTDAQQEVLNAELGKVPSGRIDQRIALALAGAANWILIGGPPCQAYSLAGRARRANDENFEADEKHFLYREYLRILRVHAPPVFVMENVKGLLSSHHAGSPMFSRIQRDLSAPAKGLSYEIRSLVREDDGYGLRPDDFLMQSENYGIPQTRHRVILLGVRSDLAHRKSRLLVQAKAAVTVGQTLAGLPAIRSRLSRGADTVNSWHDALRSAPLAVRGWGVRGENHLIAAMGAAARNARLLEDIGSAFIAKQSTLVGAPRALADWLKAPGLGGVIQHQSRQHMASDLARYLFAATYAQEFGSSPRLSAFPSALLPAHENAKGDLEYQHQAPFQDRFKVQCHDLPSSTIVSHISKDGHYYIHPDPVQCRSLTVREAARLQTFPEDYFFEGNRTQQYVQVGNAVPPLLAFKIAEIVRDLVQDHDGRRQAARPPAVTDPQEA
jgi:DNA (cytosine-5)-methyltransferase 1